MPNTVDRILSAASAAVDPNIKRGRSRIGNGSALLPHVDGRSTWARFMRDTYNSLLTHLGGEDYCSETQRMQARRVACIEAELIYIEDRIARKRANGEEPNVSDLDLYTRLTNGQRRHCEAIGWSRTARDVSPDLRTYIDGKAKKVGDD
jgi:hypothetical protein